MPWSGAGGPFKPYFGLSGALGRVRLSSCLEAEEVHEPDQRFLSPLLLPSPPISYFVRFEGGA